MSDDWRLRIELADAREAGELAELLQSGTVEHELDQGSSERVIVSLDGAEVFAYAGTREQAQHAADAIRALAAKHGWQLEQQLARWHPVAEAWEDPDVQLPGGEAELQAERARLTDSERAQSAALGYPEWEVRVQCSSHHETVALAEKLTDEGIPHLRRWRYLVVGATDEASAQQLAVRLRGECPQDATVTIEESLAAIAATLPPNPFAVLGGLGL